MSAHLDVVYDGLCLFCIRSLRLIQRFDRQGALVLHDANDVPAVHARFTVLREADLGEAMYVVDCEGAVHAGFYAFRRIAWELPLLRPLAALLHLPGVAAIGSRVYAVVARNRRKLGCRIG